MKLNLAFRVVALKVSFHAYNPSFTIITLGMVASFSVKEIWQTSKSSPNPGVKGVVITGATYESKLVT